MQYKIPQNVQIEDKIVGPLTLKQLGILGFGGAITYAIYTVLAKNYFIEIWLPAIMPTTILTLCFTFVNINTVPFYRWIFLVVEYFKNPRKRSFHMGAADKYEATVFAKGQEKEENEKDKEQTPEERHDKLKKIGEISKLVDQQPLH